MITFTKLRDGSWGLRGPVDDLYPGVVVTVARRDGTTTRAAVGRIVWSGDGIALATAGTLNAAPARHGGCDCGEEDCCRPRCQCDAHCNCRGGNIYNC